MIARHTRIIFTSGPKHWARNPEFCTRMNAGSPIASAFEPCLNKVMTFVQDSLPASKGAVRREIVLFIQ